MPSGSVWAAAPSLGLTEPVPALLSLAAGLEFDRWLNTPGWPPFLPDLSPGQQLMRPAEELAELWAADGLNMEAIEAVDIMAWRTYQLVYFLDQVLQKSPLPAGECQLSSRCPEGTRGDVSWSSQLAEGHEDTSGGVLAHGHQPISTPVSSMVPGVWEAFISVGGTESQGKCVLEMWGRCSGRRNPAVPRLALLGCHLPLSPLHSSHSC